MLRQEICRRTSGRSNIDANRIPQREYETYSEKPFPPNYGMPELIFLTVSTVVISVICALCTRKAVLAAWITASVLGVLNVIHETVIAHRQNRETFGIGFDDLVLWGPMLFIVAFVPTFLLGWLVGAITNIVSRRRNAAPQESSPSLRVDLGNPYQPPREI